MIKNRSKRGALGVVLMAIMGVLMSSVSPAGAVGETGAGTSTGEFTVLQTNPEDPPLPQIPDDVPLCLEVTRATLELHNVGTFTATDLTGRSTYVGRSHAVITAQAKYWFNPAGTFADDECIIPAAVPVSIVVNEEGVNAGDVECTGNGIYNRTGENSVVTTALTNVAGSSHPATATPGDAWCEVTDSLTAVPRETTDPTVLTFEGLQQPCLPMPLPDVCTSTTVNGVPVYTEWVGTYNET